MNHLYFIKQKGNLANTYLSGDAMNEYICAKNGKFCREQDFQNGVREPFAITVLHRIVTVYTTKMKFGKKKLSVRVLKECALARICRF